MIGLLDKVNAGGISIKAGAELSPIEEHDVKLVLVEIVNITEDCKQDKFCRLFQVPDDLNKDVLKEKVYNI